MQLRLQTAAHAMLECLKASAWYATIYVRTHTHSHTQTHTHTYAELEQHTSKDKHTLHSRSSSLNSPRLKQEKEQEAWTELWTGGWGREQVVFARSFGFDKQLWPQCKSEREGGERDRNSLPTTRTINNNRKWH